MKKTLITLLFLHSLCGLAQNDSLLIRRIGNIENQLALLSIDNNGLTENLKLDINVSRVPLSNFLLAVAEVHGLNLNIDPELQGMEIVNNFSNVTVADLLVFLCKIYDLDITFTGNILSIRPYRPPPEIPKEKEVLAQYDAVNNLITLDLKNDTLEKVFRKITDLTGQNLLYANGIESVPLSLYIRSVTPEIALNKLAASNGLTYSKSRDGLYLFDKLPTVAEGSAGLAGGRPRAPRNGAFNYQVLDTLKRIVSVDFTNVPVADVIEALSSDLKLDIYLATPLTEAGTTSIRTRAIGFDELLTKIFESQTLARISESNSNDVANTGRGNSNARNLGQPISDRLNFTFKKENGLYYFGTEDQLSVRKIEVVQMMHRSVELLSDPVQSSGYSRRAGRTNFNGFNMGGINYLGGFSGSSPGLGTSTGLNTGGFTNSRPISSNRAPTESTSTATEAIVNILPDELIEDLDIKIDFELNSFLVSGPADRINRFKKFLVEIDKPVPVVLIEVMIIEVRKSSTVETGISWGIGDREQSTRGSVFPETDLTLGASTVNKIIGGFDGFGSFNIGKVVPEFFTTIKAMEANGNIKIRSTPKLSTLNGHRANLSIGETTYYVVTSQNFFGSQIPTASEIRNFQPIDAELAVSIKPLVSGNGQVTLDINVIQSDFSGERIDEDAPPGLTSREFSSIIRMQNQDLAILGGLEEKFKNDSGTGVPFLARIPVIKWLFSKRKREDSKQKLTILIKPTVIY